MAEEASRRWCVRHADGDESQNPGRVPAEHAPGDDSAEIMTNDEDRLDFERVEEQREVRRDGARREGRQRWGRRLGLKENEEISMSSLELRIRRELSNCGTHAARVTEHRRDDDPEPGEREPEDELLPREPEKHTGIRECSHVLPDVVKELTRHRGSHAGAGGSGRRLECGLKTKQAAGQGRHNPNRSGALCG